MSPDISIAAGSPEVQFSHLLAGATVFVRFFGSKTAVLVR